MEEIVHFERYHPLGHPRFIEDAMRDGRITPFVGVSGYDVNKSQQVGRIKAAKDVLALIMGMGDGVFHGMTVTKDPDRGAGTGE